MTADVLDTILWKHLQIIIAPSLNFEVLFLFRKALQWDCSWCQSRAASAHFHLHQQVKQMLPQKNSSIYLFSLCVGVWEGWLLSTVITSGRTITMTYFFHCLEEARCVCGRTWPCTSRSRK